MAVSRRVRIFLWVVCVFAVTAIIVTASIAFIVFRSITSTIAPAAAAEQAFADIRKMYPDRAPLVDVVNARTGDVKINRTPNAPRKDVASLYFMYWDPEDQKLVRGEAPTWITSVRVSITGVGNWSFSDYHITREDIERYSPGIIIDFKSPDGSRALAWTR